MVISNQGAEAVRSGADDSNGMDLVRIQGQKPIVFQQHHALERRLQGQGIMLVGIVLGIINAVPLAVICKHTEEESGCEQMLGGSGDLLLRHQTFLVCLQKVQIGHAAVQVAPVFEGQRSRFGCCVRHMVVLMEIADGPAVAGDVAVKLPLSPKDIHQKRFGTAGGLTVDAIVGAHHGFHLTLRDRGFKGGQIGLIHILGRSLGIKGVPDRLRAGVDRKMLGAGCRLQVVPFSLQTLNVGHAKAAGQIGIFTQCLMAAAPSRVTKDIDVRAPEGQSLVDVPIALGGLSVVLGPALRGDRIAHFPVKILIEDRSKSDGLWEDGGGASTGHAVQRFIPPVVCRNAEALDGRCIIAQLGGLFLQGHL